MEENQDLFEFKVDDTMAQEMNETSRWSRLFSILVFILCSFFLLILIVKGQQLAAIFSLQMATSESTAVFSVIIIFVVLAMAVVGLMMYFLLRSANRIKEGLRLKDQELFNRGLTDMKTYFAIFGVVSILGLLLTLLSLL
ncbi:MAG TPA: hypothetical protein VF476_05155 [Chitinophagaceae bacterium]